MDHMNQRIRVLSVEDVEDDTELIRLVLNRGGLVAEVTRVQTARTMEAALKERAWDIILSDYVMPGFTAIDALQVLKRSGRSVPFVVVSGAIGEELAVLAMRKGASDVVNKNTLERLVPVVRRELSDAAARERHREAIAALRESEERFRLLTESMPQIVWKADASGRVVYANQRWCEYTQKESAGEERSVFDAVHPKDRAGTNAAWAAARATGGRLEVEHRLQGAAGSRWHLTRAIPVHGADGRVSEWLGTSTDIEPQKSAVRWRERILAVISHDLRNPLSSIILNAGLLGRAAPSGREQGSFPSTAVERILSAARRMDILIRDILTLAVIEAGPRRFRVLSRKEDAATLTRDIVEMMEPLAAAKEIRLHMDLGEGIPSVSCDRERIHQVLSNLIGNAVKFTPNGGEVRVGVTSAAGGVRIAVSDTGPGIPRKDREQIFDAFWKGESERARGDGVGLGLAISRDIVEAHGARIEVSDAAGGGASFSFVLPAADQERRSPEAA